MVASIKYETYFFSILDRGRSNIFYSQNWSIPSPAPLPMSSLRNHGTEPTLPSPPTDCAIKPIFKMLWIKFFFPYYSVTIVADEVEPRKSSESVIDLHKIVKGRKYQGPFIEFCKLLAPNPSDVITDSPLTGKKNRALVQKMRRNLSTERVQRFCTYALWCR